MRKHTEGPWDIYWLEGILQAEPHAFLKSGGSKSPFLWIKGKCGDQNDENSSKQFQEDVHLMAAAPDLLEACELALEGIDRFTNRDVKPFFTEAIEKLEMAIAMAKGEDDE